MIWMAHRGDPQTARGTVSIDRVLRDVESLPADWHGAGSLTADVLRAFCRHLSGRRLRHTAETGTGKSTLLFSHLSPNHTVFTRDDRGDGNSLRQVTDSPLLNRGSVEFILGPTQQTIPRYAFSHKFQVVFLDGPHGYPFPELEYYYFYPHLETDGLLIVDDIHIPTIYRLFEFLSEDEMFTTLAVVNTTAFFRRTARPLFDPLQDGWWLQAYNKARFPAVGPRPPEPTWGQRLRARVPGPVKALVRKARARLRPSG